MWKFLGSNFKDEYAQIDTVQVYSPLLRNPYSSLDFLSMKPPKNEITISSTIFFWKKTDP